MTKQRRYRIEEQYDSRPCGTQHRTYAALARCVWPSAGKQYVSGDGPFASVSFCRRCLDPREWGRWRQVTTVELHASLAEAQYAVSRIDRIGCGGGCSHYHEIFELDLPNHAWRQRIHGAGNPAFERLAAQDDESPHPSRDAG